MRYTPSQSEAQISSGPDDELATILSHSHFDARGTFSSDAWSGVSQMLVTKGVKVHGDTHRVLKEIKEKNRSKSMDEVIRSLVKGATGKSVEEYSAQRNNTRLSSFAE
jgi:hypothetical protein